MSTFYIKSPERGGEELEVDEWLIRTVMVLYTEACTIVRTDAGLGESLK